MSKGEQMEHLVQMIKGNVYHCYITNTEANYGYVTRLAGLADEGVFAAEGTLEEMGLGRAAMELRKLAGEIERVRSKLLENSRVTA